MWFIVCADTFLPTSPRQGFLRDFSCIDQAFTLVKYPHNINIFLLKSQKWIFILILYYKNYKIARIAAVVSVQPDNFNVDYEETARSRFNARGTGAQCAVKLLQLKKKERKMLKFIDDDKQRNFEVLVTSSYSCYSI